MITLHYEGLNNRNEDLNEVIFSSHESFMFWMHKLLKRDDNKTVYLFATEFDLENIEDKDLKRFKDSNKDKEIFIESSIHLLYNTLNHTKQGSSYSGEIDFVFFLQEYESFEDAYKVALSMREPNPLCYNAD